MNNTVETSYTLNTTTITCVAKSRMVSMLLAVAPWVSNLYIVPFGDQRKVLSGSDK